MKGSENLPHASVFAAVYDYIIPYIFLLVNGESEDFWEKVLLFFVCAEKTSKIYVLISEKPLTRQKI